MEKTRFVMWETMTDAAMRETGCTAEDARNIVRNRLQEWITLGVDDGTAATHVSVEASWEADGHRSYYKVHPGIARMLAHTSIDIPVEALQPTYCTFNVQLPADDCPLPIYNGTALVTIQTRHDLEVLREEVIRRDSASGKALCLSIDANLKRWENRNGREVHAMVVLVFQTPEDKQTDVVSTTTFYLLKGRTVGESLDEFAEFTSQAEYFDQRNLPEADLRRLVAIICGVCCFASGQTDLLAPDLQIEPPAPRQKRHGKAAEALERMEAEREARKHAKALERCRGWHVGREIELPRWHHTSESEGESREGHALSYSHIRSGHLRMQACGPRLQERKVVFIKPVVVRPDLPASPSPRGFKITDRVLQGNQ